jgi:phage terminase Nu1 subunit (DNA packaging protein)
LTQRKPVTRLELAKALETNPRTIAKWLEEGMPVKTRGRGGRASVYDLGEVKAWLRAREKAASGEGGPFDAMQARAERDRWQAKLAEQTHQMRERTLLPAAEVEKAWSSTVTAIRAQLLLIPITYADRILRVARLEGVTGVQATLEEAVYGALRELAGPTAVAEKKPTKPRSKTRARSKAKTTRRKTRR